MFDKLQCIHYMFCFKICLKHTYMLWFIVVTGLFKPDCHEQSERQERTQINICALSVALIAHDMLTDISFTAETSHS